MPLLVRRLPPTTTTSPLSCAPAAGFTPLSAATARGLHPAWVVLVISLWLASACNVPLWRALAALPGQSSLRDWGFALMFGLIVAAGHAALLSLLAWRLTLKPAVTVLLLMAGCGAYFMLAYGILIDADMLKNVLQTDLHEAGDLLTWRLPATVLALAAPPLLWLYPRPLQRVGVWRQLGRSAWLLAASSAVFLACLLLVFQDFSSTMRNHTRLRYLINPINSVFALGDLAFKTLHPENHTLYPLGRDAQLGASYSGQSQAPLLILVLGETGRSGNFGLNGYARPTTPRLSARSDLSSARNAWSCGTSTAASLPCMFSHLGKSAFESSSGHYESLLDVLQHAGLAVLWVDNQSGCKGVCDRVAYANIPKQKDKDPALCPGGGECFDNILLKDLEQRLAALPAEQRARGTVVVLHQMGSHGPAYYKRSPAALKQFQPECTSSALQECQQQQIVNAYDNSILATDQLLENTINWLQSQYSQAPTAMIYVADHGESLGENNLYLHGLPYRLAPDVQKQVPWITWLSPALQTRSKVSTACLQTDLRERRITHDAYFHSVLGLLDVHSSAYQPAQDIYAACRQPTPPS